MTANESGDSAAGKFRVYRLWHSRSYTFKVTCAFAFISIMTVLLAIGVLSYTWEQHFQSYTKENIQRVADNTAASIAVNYEKSGVWYTATLQPASSASQLSEGIGILVQDAHENVLFDDTVQKNDSGVSLAPSSKQNTVMSPIMVKGEQVGTVYVWTYGTESFLTQADSDFRSTSYRAMLAAALFAVVLSLGVGFVFGRRLVNPVNVITTTARSIKEGDLKARTGFTGDDEIARLGETFDLMADAVENDRLLERRLTTDVAHELRTPLMAIQSTVEAMADGVFEPSPERLETVNSEVQRLSRLVDALLKLSRLENRSTPVERTKLDLSELLTTIVSTHEAYVNDAGLKLDFVCADDVFVFGNADMLRQATANLISNAVRYTPEGGTITVEVKKSEGYGQISVRDTGIGLTDEEAKMVFARFWRADAGRNRATGGLGIGLSVVKEIVERHAGHVEVYGKPNEGAVFTLDIPLYDEDASKRRKNMQKKRDK